jgi:hypothetical protein
VRQFVQRTGLGRTGVRGGEDAQASLRLRLSILLRTLGRDLLQHILQLAHARHGDEADQYVHLVARSQLATNLLQQ